MSSLSEEIVLPDSKFWCLTSIGISMIILSEVILVMVCHTDISVNPYMWNTITPLLQAVINLLLDSSEHFSPPIAKIRNDEIGQLSLNNMYQLNIFWIGYHTGLTMKEYNEELWHCWCWYWSGTGVCVWGWWPTWRCSWRWQRCRWCGGQMLVEMTSGPGHLESTWAGWQCQ